MILPFMVGFDFPDSTGTYIGASAGGGHYRFTPACSRYTYGAAFQEGGFSVQHRKALAVPESGAPRSKLAPSHVTFAAGGNLIHRRMTALSFDDAPEYAGGPPRSPLPGDPVIGSQRDRIGWMGRTKVGFDWKWVGAEFGACLLDYGHGREVGDTGIYEDIIALPVLGLRLGNRDSFYGTVGFMESDPLVSGGGIVSLGMGIKASSTRIWYGYAAAPNEGSFQIKASQSREPFRFVLSGQVNPMQLGSKGEYALALGLGYKLPGKP
jgi:hypothetical protein